MTSLFWFVFILYFTIGCVIGIAIGCPIVFFILVPIQRTIMLYPKDSLPGRWAEGYSWFDYLVWHYKVLFEDFGKWLKRKGG